MAGDAAVVGLRLLRWLQGALIEAGFEAFVEAACKPHYTAKMGAPSIPPGRYFRMHIVGYCEGIDSEWGIEWRCADPLSLRQCLSLQTTERVLGHFWLSKTRSRLPGEVHGTVFGWVLPLIAEHGLVKADRIGVDAATMEANAALRTIVCRDSGETYREMLKRRAEASGIETPSADDLVRMDRARKGKKLSNEDRVSKTDPEAKIAKMKDGTTHLGYKPEHAVGLDTGAVIAAEIHPANDGDTTTLPGTLTAAEATLAKVGRAPTAAEPSWSSLTPRPPWRSSSSQLPTPTSPSSSSPSPPSQHDHDGHIVNGLLPLRDCEALAREDVALGVGDDDAPVPFLS